MVFLGNCKSYKKCKHTYLNFSSFHYSGVKLLSCSISIGTIGKCHKTETFGASFVEDDLHVENGAKFLQLEVPKLTLEMNCQVVKANKQKFSHT